MSAWFHKLLSTDRQKENAEAVAKSARQFAHGEYAQALEKGDQLSDTEYKKVVSNIARFTGLKPTYIEQTNLQINPQRWFKELMRDKRRTVGRLDPLLRHGRGRRRRALRIRSQRSILRRSLPGRIPGLRAPRA